MREPTYLVTGGSGFFGSLLLADLLHRGMRCVNVDLERSELEHPLLTNVRGDIRDAALMERLFAEHGFTAVFHCAAVLAHAVKDKNFLWTSNVDGTRTVADAAKRHGLQKFIFISSNCLWGEDVGHPIAEDEPPHPVEIYGRSKLEGEKILLPYADSMDVIIFRCCTIIDSGRLGLLAILFEFIDEGRKVWVVGGGDNVYQFIYAGDLIQACVQALDYTGSGIFHVGSDDVKSFREVYQSVIRKAKTGARVASLPRAPTLAAMRLAHALGMSPLGPYQYKMISSNFLFDTSKAKRELHWAPTLTNEEMLWKAYEYYHTHRRDIENRTDVSAHRKAASMGVIRLLKWFS